MKDGNINLSELGPQLSVAFKKVRTYSALIFFLIVASLYGFILWRINVYSGIPANQNNSSSRVAGQPHIDSATVQKILQLQNNSVNVQALFNQARENPFQE